MFIYIWMNEIVDFLRFFLHLIGSARPMLFRVFVIDAIAIVPILIFATCTQEDSSAVWKYFFLVLSFNSALDSHQWFFKAWMDGSGNGAKRKWEIKIMIGLSIFLCWIFFWCRFWITRYQRCKKPPLESLLVSLLEGLHSLSGECLRCDQFFVHLWCAFLIGNLLICFGGKNQKFKFS